jgi:hypothetical protein
MKTPLLATALWITVRLSYAGDPDLAKLQKSYDEAVKRAVDPITTTYRAELQKLLEQHTKAGRLEAAVEVKTVLDDLTKKPQQAPIQAVKADEALLRKKLTKGRFVFYFSPPRSKLFTFSGSGKIDEGGAPQEFKWKLEGAELFIYNEPGQLAYALEYDAASDSFKTSGKPSLYMSRKAYLVNAPQ